MTRKISLSILLTFAVSQIATAGDGNRRTSREEYIALHKEDALKDMSKTGVPASITLAQALLESEDGNSALAREANNHFGIKCAGWQGASFIKDDDERDECFRKYNSVLESYDDHSDFLRTRSRYAFLFELDKTDYKSWAKGLKKAGYATNPEYAERLIKIIEDNQLHQLDRGNEFPVAYNPPVASNESRSAGKRSYKKVFVPSTAVINPYGSHEVMMNNNVEYVIAKRTDTYNKITSEFELGSWQVYKYNEINKNAPIAEGQKIYIKPKRRSNDQHFYFTQEGDNMHSISQEFGVKVRLLYKYNHMQNGSEPKPGQRVWLEKHKE